MAVTTIDRATYKAKKAHDYAGTVATLAESTVAAWKESEPDWTGKHWHLESGPALAPVNVTR
ncbi:hypothetical protein [Nocardia asteroides]|uniref:hypothetical protein n=1 Tax=Nocardia asteroides TaxID=1824 RepID=UPI001E5CADE5|nr:hypothetical protein [Nocardia asteroides]UGT58840.1 hypothetical protein LTT85_33350 [Nocardia asteroides]